MAAIPGWQRFKPAEDWLRQHNMPLLSQTTEAEKIRFDRFVAERRAPVSSDPAARAALFREFMEWLKRGEPGR